MARGGDMRDMREFLIELEESAKAGDLARNERSLESLRRPELKAFVEVLKLKGIKSYAPKREFYVAVVDALVDQGLHGIGRICRLGRGRDSWKGAN